MDARADHGPSSGARALLMVNAGLSFMREHQASGVLETLPRHLQVSALRDARVILKGGVPAKNVFWQVGTQTTLGTTASFQGIILGGNAIVLNTGAVLTGRALAQTAVTLDASEVVQPNK